MGRVKGPPKDKFSSNLPAGMLERVNRAADQEGIAVNQVFEDAVQMWLDQMDGKAGEVFKPTHRELHRRLEACLNRRDEKLTALIDALLRFGGG